MPLTPGYGETPLPHDELMALVADAVEILDPPITRAAVYDLEQGFQDRASEELMPAAIDGSRALDELLSDHFVAGSSYPALRRHLGLGRPVEKNRGRHRRRARTERR